MKKTARLDRFGRFSKEFIPRIDACMNRFFKEKIRAAGRAQIRGMYEMLQEYCSREGKRIRPLVLLASYSGYGGVPGVAVIRMASVLELMHAFLLIQDDIIDRSSLRRGGKSLHVVCGEKFGSMTYNENIGSDISLVLADVLFANSLEIISGSEVSPRVKNKFLRVFSDTYEITAWGQVLDILHSHPQRIDHTGTAALDIARMKTAYYTIYYPMLMGYVLAGGDSAGEKKLIEKFSLPMGLAFQINDDIQGVFGKEKATGKPADSDILEGKRTLLVDGTIRVLSGTERARLIALFTKKKKGAADIEGIRKLILDSGSLDEARLMHRKLLDEACGVLQNLALTKKSMAILMGLIERIAET